MPNKSIIFIFILHTFGYSIKTTESEKNSQITDPITNHQIPKFNHDQGQLKENLSRTGIEKKEDEGALIFNIFIGTFGLLFVLILLIMFILGLRRSYIDAKYKEKVRRARENLIRGRMVCIEEHKLDMMIKGFKQLRANPRFKKTKVLTCNGCTVLIKPDEDFYGCREMCKFFLCGNCFIRAREFRRLNLMNTEDTEEKIMQESTVEDKILLNQLTIIDDQFQVANRSNLIENVQDQIIASNVRNQQSSENIYEPVESMVVNPNSVQNNVSIVPERINNN